VLVSGAGVVGAGWVVVSLGAGDRFCGAEEAGWPLLATEDEGASGGVGSGVLLATLSLAEGVLAEGVVASAVLAGAAGVTLADSCVLSWLVV
jgi:hypothetical protein